ncbi:MAG TPA: outer membrane protein transport protein [Balneolaceae bacterium]|nr:outer membrane protein transport protein [Balneolaceae bacterium]
MSKKSYFAFILLSVLTITTSTIKAQSADDVLRYSLEYPSYDAISLVKPAVSSPTGFGAFQENPAVMALYKKSYFSFDLSSRFLDETGTYLGNRSNYSDNQTGVGDIGILYKVPTSRGSLVIGGGYSQTTDFNRALSASGYNSQSTITDFYSSLPRNDGVNTAAYDAFAIEDVNADSSVSILRYGANYSAYPGINQDIQLTERGAMGEYSAFMATELLKNFTVGASIGYLNGSYAYRRDFLESDRRNNFNGQIIDPIGDSTYTDINNILSHDKINADIQAFSARLGFVYNPSKEFNFGMSYEFPSSLHIDENYNTVITTTFDNGTQTQPQDAPGKFSYKIIRPQRLKAGFSAGFENLSLSASAEFVPYTQGKIDYNQIQYTSQEDEINANVRSSLQDVINLRAGIEYKLNEQFTPRLGYAYFPSPQKGLDRSRNFLSGGFSAELTKGLMFDFGLQYSFWKDRNTMYNTPVTSESVRENVTRIHVMTGIRMQL